MMNTITKPKLISLEIARAYEIITGFVGICDFYVERGHFRYAEESESRNVKVIHPIRIESTKTIIQIREGSMCHLSASDKNIPTLAR